MDMADDRSKWQITESYSIKKPAENGDLKYARFTKRKMSDLQQDLQKMKKTLDEMENEWYINQAAFETDNLIK